MILIRDGCYAEDPHQRLRARIVAAVDRGVRVAEVARRSGCSRNTVYYWLRLYKKYRDPGVLSSAGPRSGPGAG